jgi:hypothetical protein
VLLRRVFSTAGCAVSLILAAANYCPLTVLAGASFQPPNPDELKMTSEPLAPGAPAVILYRQVDRDDNGQTTHEDDYSRIKILTEEGRKYGNIEIPFFKETEDIVNVRARTIKRDGSIAEFDGKVCEKPLAKERGSRFMAKTFTLPDVQVGSIIEYYFTYDFNENFVYQHTVMLYGSQWILSSDLFTKSARFSLKPYRASYGTMHLRWSWHDLPPGSDPKEGPDNIVRMEASNIPAFQTEDFMPPVNELKSRVDFIYTDELPESNPDKFWKNVGKKRNGQLESFVGKRKAMEGSGADRFAR